mgnify:FL=1
MRDLAEIRNDLKDIKYYYSRKSTFDEASDYLGIPNNIIVKVKIYNEAMQDAPPKLYDIYYSLYVKNYTQESLADKLGFTLDYIQKANAELIRYIKRLENIS